MHRTGVSRTYRSLDVYRWGTSGGLLGLFRFVSRPEDFGASGGTVDFRQLVLSAPHLSQIHISVRLRSGGSRAKRFLDLQRRETSGGSLVWPRALGAPEGRVIFRR